jgi:hypothetical protein
MAYMPATTASKETPTARLYDRINQKGLYSHCWTVDETAHWVWTFVSSLNRGCGIMEMTRSENFLSTARGKLSTGIAVPASTSLVMEISEIE